MNINDIRNLPEIQSIIKECEGFGRTWGTQGSSFHGSHITFITQEAVVVLCQGKKQENYKFTIANFIAEKSAQPQVTLKEKILSVLAKHGIAPEER